MSNSLFVLEREVFFVPRGPRLRYGGTPNFHYRVFTINIARVTLYLTDKNKFGDIFVAAKLAIPFRISISRMLNSTKDCDRKEQGYRSRESHRATDKPKCPKGGNPPLLPYHW